MSKKYIIKVSDMVVVPVKCTIADESGNAVEHAFSLVAKRTDAASLRGRGEAKGFVFSEFLADVCTGWSGQKLVLEEDGTPAAFCADALEALLNIAGMGLVCFNAYVSANGAQSKN